MSNSCSITKKSLIFLAKSSQNDWANNELKLCKLIAIQTFFFDWIRDQITGASIRTVVLKWILERIDPDLSEEEADCPRKLPDSYSVRGTWRKFSSWRIDFSIWKNWRKKKACSWWRNPLFSSRLKIKKYKKCQVWLNIRVVERSMRF